MRFESVDRLPCVEWAPWWDQTIARWKREGLPQDLEGVTEIQEYFGLAPIARVRIGPKKCSCPEPAYHGAPLATTEAEYEALRPHLFPSPEILDQTAIEASVARQAKGELLIWVTLEGFFWFPRTLFGIEKHLLAFYEAPALMKAMNEDVLDYNLRMLEAFCAMCTPDFMTFAEDMSYNHGPMIGKELFDEFMAPYYARIVPALEARKVPIVIDSDGDIAALISWYEQVGIKGFLPLERQAGCDIAAMRERHPDVRFIGAFDKMVMHKGEGAMRAEFERLLPVMRQGGYIPSVDHQTPPGVALDDYRLYVRLLEEYCERAAQ